MLRQNGERWSVATNGGFRILIPVDCRFRCQHLGSCDAGTGTIGSRWWPSEAWAPTKAPPAGSLLLLRASPG